MTILASAIACSISSCVRLAVRHERCWSGRPWLRQRARLCLSAKTAICIFAPTAFQCSFQQPLRNAVVRWRMISGASAPARWITSPSFKVPGMSILGERVIHSVRSPRYSIDSSGGIRNCHWTRHWRNSFIDNLVHLLPCSSVNENGMFSRRSRAANRIANSHPLLPCLCSMMISTVRFRRGAKSQISTAAAPPG